MDKTEMIVRKNLKLCQRLKKRTEEHGMESFVIRYTNRIRVYQDILDELEKSAVNNT